MRLHDTCFSFDHSNLGAGTLQCLEYLGLAFFCHWQPSRRHISRPSWQLY